MSRWKSPQTAARRAERAAHEAGKLRTENRKSKLILLAAIVLMVLSLAVYSVWTLNRIEQRGLRHQHHHGPESRSPQQSK